MNSSEQIEFYIKLFETTPDIKYVYDLETKKVIYVNNNVNELLNYTTEEIIKSNESFISIFHPDSRDLFFNEINKSRNLKDNEVNVVDYKLLHKNGEHLWFNCRTMVFKRNAEGNPVQLIGIAQNITELRQKEKALNLSETRFNDIIDLVPAAIGEWDAEGKITFVNDIVLEYTGYSREEFHNNFNITKLLVPEDRERASENIKKVSKGEELPINEYHALRKDGSTYHVIAKTHPILKDGKIIGSRGVFLNINDRKKAELALKESEEKFRTIFDNSNDAILIHDFEGNFIDFNKKAHEINEYAKEEFQKLSLKDINTEESAKFIEPHIKEIIKNGSNIFEVFHKTKSGKIMPVEVSAKIVNYFGKPIILSIFRDITERKRAEFALKESEERFRNLTDTLPVFVYELDTQFKVTYVNKFGIEFMKAKKEEVDEGIYAFDFFTPEYKQKAIDNVKSIMAGIKISSHGYDLTDKKGNIFHVISKSTPIINEGKFCGLRGVFIDITERKKAEEDLRESEEKFRVLIENTPDIIIRVNKDLKFLYINQSVEKITKIPVEKFIDRTLSELGINEEFCNFWESNITRVFKTGKSLETEYLYKGKKRIIYVNIRIIPEFDYLKEVKSVLVIGQDITEQKSNEIKISETLLEKETLLNELHHRVKNNFQIITSLFNLQEEEIKDSKQFEIFLKAKARIRAMTLVHEKLYESKNFSKIDFAEYIKLITEELHHTFFKKTKKVKIIYNLNKISINIDKAIPCGIIVNELITNSFKHAFNGNINKSYTIKILLIKTPGKKINLIINDNGKGIGEKINVENPKTLGLQLVSLLTKQIRASISLDRKKGTKWSITF
ncbi:MAG: PAS domain S-box protein [Bacteroidales bacterium]|jgi:PAS domain S-box-containing protein